MKQHQHTLYNHAIVAIGTSTGGPRALEQLLKTIPENFPAPIVIVQHMPRGFTKSLAERLNRICTLVVKEATDGEYIKRGHVYLAPGDYHMRVHPFGQQLKIRLSNEAHLLGHRPSVNLLFESLITLSTYRKIVVLLTGMGKDGAEGIIQLKESDPKTVVIAESKETAVIYGMPKAAIDTGYTTDIIQLNNISTTLVAYLKGSD